MKVLTYTSYKEHCKLYTEIHGSIAVNSCQIRFAQKDIILLSSASVTFYKAGAHTSMENNRFIKFSLSVRTYSIDHFNAKITVAILQARKDWVPPQMKDLKLVIPEYCAFMASNIFFIALGILDKYLEKTMLIESTLTPGSYKTSLDTSTPIKSLSLHCKQINKVKNELDGHSSSLVACIQVSDYKATFSPMHLVFLKLDTHWPHLDFKILDENNKVIPRTFYLQLLNKE